MLDDLLDNEDEWEKDNVLFAPFARFKDKTGDIRKQVFDYFTSYYKRGKFHRINGPARIRHANHPVVPGGLQWWINGERIPVNSQEEFEKYLKLKAFW